MYKTLRKGLPPKFCSLSAAFKSRYLQLNEPSRSLTTMIIFPPPPANRCKFFHFRSRHAYNAGGYAAMRNRVTRLFMAIIDKLS